MPLLSTTNPICVGLGSNVGLLGQRSATNRLIHGSLQRCEYGLSFGPIFAPGTTLIRNMSDAHWTEGLSLKSVPNTSYSRKNGTGACTDGHKLRSVSGKRSIETHLQEGSTPLCSQFHGSVHHISVNENTNLMQQS